MQNRNQIRSMTGHQVIHPPFGDGSITTYYGEYLQDYLNSYPVIHGNRKDPQPFSYQKFRCKRWTGTWSSYTGGLNWRTIDGPFFAPYPMIREDWRPLMDQCRAKALDRLTEKYRGHLDLSIAIAEVGKTKAMLNARNRFIKFTEKIGLYRRWKTVKALGSFWLEYQYGWKPLIGDIYDTANEAMATIRKKMYFSSSASLPMGSHIVKDHIVSASRVTCKVTGRVGVKMKVYMQLPSSKFDLARWTSLNPASIAWELTPYSFVVDWFLDVGGTLRNFETAVLSQGSFHHGYIDYLMYYDSDQELVYLGSHGGAVDGDDIIVSGHLYESDFVREVLTGYPYPRLPSFNAKLGWQRLLSAAALLTTALPKSKRYHGWKRIGPNAWQHQ